MSRVSHLTRNRKPFLRPFFHAFVRWIKTNAAPVMPDRRAREPLTTLISSFAEWDATTAGDLHRKSRLCSRIWNGVSLLMRLCLFSKAEKNVAWTHDNKDVRKGASMCTHNYDDNSYALYLKLCLFAGSQCNILLSHHTKCNAPWILWNFLTYPGKEPRGRVCEGKAKLGR